MASWGLDPHWWHSAQRPGRVQRRGIRGAFSTVVTLTTLGLIRADVHDHHAGPAVLASAARVRRDHGARAVRVVRGRADGPSSRFFCRSRPAGVVVGDDEACAPAIRWVRRSSACAFLLLALVAVVGNAKLVSPTIERAVAAAGLPQSVVGVVIALLVLLPETLAAGQAATRDRIQTSLNLAFGSAMASIGLTIPDDRAWRRSGCPVPLHLGLGGTAHRALRIDLRRDRADHRSRPGHALVNAGVHLVPARCVSHSRGQPARSPTIGAKRAAAGGASPNVTLTRHRPGTGECMEVGWLHVVMGLLRRPGALPRRARPPLRGSEAGCGLGLAHAAWRVSPRTGSQVR